MKSHHIKIYALISDKSEFFAEWYSTKCENTPKGTRLRCCPGMDSNQGIAAIQLAAAVFFCDTP